MNIKVVTILHRTVHNNFSYLVAIVVRGQKKIKLEINKKKKLKEERERWRERETFTVIIFYQHAQFKDIEERQVIDKKKLSNFSLINFLSRTHSLTHSRANYFNFCSHSRTYKKNSTRYFFLSQTHASYILLIYSS